MKNIMFTFCTKNLEPFKINFYSSLHGDFEIRHEYIDAMIENKTGGGMPIWDYKISKILEFTNQHLNKDIKIYICDVDIQFFEDMPPYVDKLFNKYNLDMAFQAESKFHGTNIGICVIKPNDRTKIFWERVYNRIKLTKQWDQEVVNHFIWRNGIENYSENVRIGILPHKMYACSTSDISPDIVLHHANCTSNFNEKWNQFDFTRKSIGKELNFSKKLIKQFLASDNVVFTSMVSDEFKQLKCNITHNCIEIEDYGSYNIKFEERSLLLYSDIAFARFDYLVYDNFFGNGLLMGYFCNKGKIRGVYNRCYFIF